MRTKATKKLGTKLKTKKLSGSDKKILLLTKKVKALKLKMASKKKSKPAESASLNS